MTWCPPSLTLVWGDYFTPDADDDTKIVNLAAAALDAGIITKRTAVVKCSRTFDIENPDAYLDTLAEEAQEKADQLAADMHAMGSIGEDGDEPAVAKSVTGKTKGAVVPRKPKAGADKSGE